MTKRISWAIALLATLALTACGPETQKPQDSGKPAHPKHKGPKLTWMTLNHRDTLNAGDSATFGYRFVNDGWGDVHLTAVENDGAYCQAEWPRQKLRIWDTAQVMLRCHFDHPGFVAQTIMVHYADDSASHAAQQVALTYYAVVRDAQGRLPEAPAPRKPEGAATGVKQH